MQQAPPRPMTADDLAAMPSGLGKRHELIEGEIIEMAAAGGRHGKVGQTFAGEIYVHLKENPMGILVAAETGFFTRGDNRTVRAPDVAFIRNEKIPAGGLPDGFLSIVPDLVIEVVSPTDRAADVDQKVQEWLNFGVQEVWVAYPSTQRVMIYRHGADSAVILNAGDTLDGGSVLPGFQRPIKSLFAE